MARRARVALDRPALTNDMPPPDTSRWRHCSVNGKPRCGAPVDSTPISATYENVCSECYRKVLQELMDRR